MLKECERRGIPYIIFKIKRTPKEEARQREIEKEVNAYVMNIEEAHKKAANSTLHFGSNGDI